MGLLDEACYAGRTHLAVGGTAVLPRTMLTHYRCAEVEASDFRWNLAASTFDPLKRAAATQKRLQDNVAPKRSGAFYPSPL